VSGLLLLTLFACEGEAVDSASPAPEAVLDDGAVAFVGDALVLDATASTGERFSWDFGDGTAASGALVKHSWEEPGRYFVRVEVATNDGRTDSATRTQVVVHRPLAEPPSQSGRLVLAGARLYAVLPDEDLVVVVEEGAVVSRWSTCAEPTSLAARGDRLLVACRMDAVQEWDLATGTLRSETGTGWGSRPEAVAFDGDTAIVALAGARRVGAVDEVASGGGWTLDDPRALAASDGVRWVPRFRSAPEAGSLQKLADAEAESLPLLPDPGPDSDTDARGVPTLLGAVAVSPDGRTVVVGGSKANVGRGLRRDGLPFTPETASRAALRALDSSTGAPLARALFDNRDVVGAVAFTPLGDSLLVAHLGAGMVDLLDPLSLTRIGGFQNVGVGLDGLATDGDTAWVLASLDKRLVAFDLRSGSADPVGRVELSEAGIDLGARVFHGAGDPRMSLDGYVSCASCHPDGSHDAQTWDFTDRSEGFRDTQALFALPAAGPFHWSGNFDELQDFENAIRAHQGGTGFLDDTLLSDPLGTPKAGLSAELDALAAYVQSFTPPRSPWRESDGSWTAEAEAGRAVFLAEGCDGCHAGPEMTDAGWNEDGTPVMHDVGTLLETSGDRAGVPLSGLRTPSLHGLHATAPYLHDGRAPTLVEALAAHGVSADPSLVRYLLEIEAGP
jgi:PKD repeat protein